MTREEAHEILAEYAKAYWEDDMLAIELFDCDEVVEAMEMGAKALSESFAFPELKEAAKEYFKQEWNSDYQDFEESVIDAFIAGARWQAEQDKETIELAEEHAYLAGAVNEREKMMKEAVEYEVGMHGEPIKITFDKYVQRARGIFPGDKVRIIIVKEDEK